MSNGLRIWVDSELGIYELLWRTVWSRRVHVRLRLRRFSERNRSLLGIAKDLRQERPTGRILCELPHCGRRFSLEVSMPKWSNNLSVLELRERQPLRADTSLRFFFPGSLLAGLAAGFFPPKR